MLSRVLLISSVLAAAQAASPFPSWWNQPVPPFTSGGPSAMPQSDPRLTFGVGPEVIVNPPVSPREVIAHPEVSEPKCSIPPINALSRSHRVPPMRRYRPPAGRFHTRYAQVPAPACGDQGRR